MGVVNNGYGDGYYGYTCKLLDCNCNKKRRNLHYNLIKNNNVK